MGREKFDIRVSADRIEARAEIELRVEQDGKTVESKSFPALVMNAAFEPVTYTWSQKGAQTSELSIDFRASPVKCRYRTVSGQEDNRDFSLPKDVVLLDDNVLHHYQLVVDRLGRAALPQTFRAFVPQEASPGELTVEEVPDTSKLRHLRVSTELTRIDLWVDEHNRLERLAIPEAQFEAVREP